MSLAVVIHSLAHARAALAAASRLKVPVTLMSAEAAAGNAGPMWFLEVIEAARAEFPGVRLTAVLDCGEAPGFALAALRAGCGAIRFKGRGKVTAKIKAIAKQCGAKLIERRGRALDLFGERDPLGACVAWLARGQGAGYQSKPRKPKLKKRRHGGKS
jgi:hypothetical protein